MPVGCLLDKNTPPGDYEIQAALRGALPYWQELIQFIYDTYDLSTEISFGGKNYGWNLWYRKGGKTLASLYPQNGYLVAQVVLGKDQVERAMTLSLGDRVGRLVRETPQLHDGKWLFIPVESEIDVNDVKQLLLIKRKPAKPKKTT